MTNQTLLAAVHAAANEPASAPAADQPSQQKETHMAETQNGAHAAPAKITSAAELQAAYPDLCNSLLGTARNEGATAERARILGIESLASQMKGHEKLISDMKADGNTTKEQAALRLVEAENRLRANQLQGVKDVEVKTGKIESAPAGGGEKPKFEQTPDGWKAEWQSDAKLKAEFPTAESYVATKRREALKVVGA